MSSPTHKASNGKIEKMFVACIHVLVVANSQSEACGAISEGIGEPILDWSYARVGRAYLPPIVQYQNLPYEDGDFINNPVDMQSLP